MEKRIKTPLTWLAAALVLIMAGSLFANLFNTSFYKVGVAQIKFPTDKGVMSGLLYMPAGAGPASPRPAIITTHGYLNAKEMQAAPAIEMSRRGYVVLALDCYAHGDSFLNTVPKGGEFMSYWPSSVYDAVKYMYGQNYVLKDKEGNGIIAVSGHSMGGFSSTMAVAMDEREYLKNLQEGKPGARKIKAVLSVGADYRWTTFLGVDAAAADKLYANRTAGTIAARYDEFFFDDPAQLTGKTMVRKDYVNTDTGRIFLRNPADPKPGIFYPTAEGGKRVIYQPAQTHPWNHISVKTTGHMIDFYETAFEDYKSITAPKKGQIWLLKELLEALGLIGFYMLFIPLVTILADTKLLKGAVTEPVASFSGPVSAGNKLAFWILAVVSALFPALIYITSINKAAPGLAVIRTISLILFIASTLAVIASWALKKKEYLNYLVLSAGSFLVLGLAAGSRNIFLLGTKMSSPVTNNVAFWAVMVTAITLVILSLAYRFLSRPYGMTYKQYGFIAGGKTILSALVVAVITAAAGFIILFIVNSLFKTDFRLWLVAVRAFNKQHLITALRYMPFFFLYFLINGIALQANTNSDYLKGAKGYWVALLINVGGLVGWLILQYGLLFISGTAPFTNQALNSIVLIGLTVNLGIATVITKKCLDKTNNVYTGAFLNTILITVVTISSSTMYWSLAG